MALGGARGRLDQVHYRNDRYKLFESAGTWAAEQVEQQLAQQKFEALRKKSFEDLRALVGGFRLSRLPAARRLEKSRKRKRSSASRQGLRP